MNSTYKILGRAQIAFLTFLKVDRKFQLTRLENKQISTVLTDGGYYTPTVVQDRLNELRLRFKVDYIEYTHLKDTSHQYV